MSNFGDMKYGISSLQFSIIFRNPDLGSKSIDPWSLKIRMQLRSISQVWSISERMETQAMSGEFVQVCQTSGDWNASAQQILGWCQIFCCRSRMHFQLQFRSRAIILFSDRGRTKMAMKNCAADFRVSFSDEKVMNPRVEFQLRIWGEPIFRFVFLYLVWG